MSQPTSLGDTIVFLKNTATALYSSTKWEYFVAGAIGGVASTLPLHPLDLIRVRLQANEGLGKAQGRPHYSSMFNAGKTILKNSGLRGLYQGIVPNIVGSGSSWGLYMLSYNTLKRKEQRDGQGSLGPLMHMRIAAQSGLFALVITNPILVANTRICLQYNQTTGSKQFTKNDPRQYRGMVDCLVKTYKVNGVAGLYKGFVPGVLGTSSGAIYFMVYEELKILHNSYYEQNHDAKLSSLAYIGCTTVSRTLATSITFPFQLISTRLQDQHVKYSGVMHVIKETYRHEGKRGFYKGLLPGLGKVLPASAIGFLVYENVMHFLLGSR